MSVFRIIMGLYDSLPIPTRIIVYNGTNTCIVYATMHQRKDGDTGMYVDVDNDTCITTAS